MNSISFGELIRKERLEQKKPIRDIAAQINLDSSLLSKIERNKLSAPIRVIPLLAQALHLDYEDLQKKYWSERIYYEIRDQDYAKESLELALQRLEKEREGTSEEIEKAQLIQRIREYLARQPIEKVWLFGSFARNEASIDSDLDLLVRFERPHKIDLFDYIGMRQDIEDLTGRQVDLVEEGQILPKIKPFIDREKQLIYERQAV